MTVTVGWTQLRLEQLFQWATEAKKSETNVKQYDLKMSKEETETDKQLIKITVIFRVKSHGEVFNKIKFFQKILIKD